MLVCSVAREALWGAIKSLSYEVLFAVIQAWIDIGHEVDYIEPTLQVLVDAVAHIMGGHNQALAEKIAGTDNYIWEKIYAK